MIEVSLVQHFLSNKFLIIVKLTIEISANDCWAEVFIDEILRETI